MRTLLLLGLLLAVPSAAPWAQAAPVTQPRTDAREIVRVALASTGAYIVGGAIGYQIGAGLDENTYGDAFYISEKGLYGIALVGTVASGWAAHVMSRPDDPLWRTVLVPLAAQGLVFAGANLLLPNPDGTVVLGAPAVAIVFSTSLSLWD